MTAAAKQPSKKLTKRMKRDGYIRYVNKLLEEIGSRYRLTIENPSMRHSLFLTNLEENARCSYVKAYCPSEQTLAERKRYFATASTTMETEVYDMVVMLYDLLYRLRLEGLLRKEGEMEIDPLELQKVAHLAVRGPKLIDWEEA